MKTRGVVQMAVATIFVLMSSAAVAQEACNAQRPQYVMGDTWVYESGDAEHTLALERREGSTLVMKQVDKKGRITYIIFSPDTNPMKRLDENGRILQDFGEIKMYQFPLVSGAEWSQNYTVTDKQSQVKTWRASAKVRGPETVTVPVGTFVACRIDVEHRNLSFRGPGDLLEIQETVWYVPSVKRMVKITSSTGKNIQLKVFIPGAADRVAAR